MSLKASYRNWRANVQVCPQGQAFRVVPIAEQFSANLCYASLAISLPGYGKTEVNGGSDREIIVRIVVDGVLKVREISWVDRERVMLYGFSRGAVFAAALMDRSPQLSGVVLHSGAYDLRRLYDDTPSGWVRQSLSPNGEPHPKLFNFLPEVSSWGAPILILHGDKDQVIPVSQAFLLRDRLETLQKPYRFVVFPDAGHRLPLNGVREEVLSFLTQHVGTACERR